MMSLFSEHHSFVLLISPPASGKTSYLLKLVDEYPQFQWVFVSPLRALADEFQNRVGTKMLVETAEKLMAKKYESYFERSDVIFVLDEFHLFSLWGESFRFSLLHIWYKVATSKSHTLGLSASMTVEEMRKLKSQVTLNYTNGYIVDCGNLEFKYPPRSMMTISSDKPNQWSRYIEWELYKRAWGVSFQTSQGSLMIFVSYRSQVDDLVNKARSLGLIALGCKGGEVQDFSNELIELNFKVDVIVSTSCLSHGVNLPQFDKVIINHLVSDSFWLQMAARGGRRGEPFELVYCKDDKSHWSFYYLLRMYLSKIHLCFMKEFWFINRLIRNAIS